MQDIQEVVEVIDTPVNELEQLVFNLETQKNAKYDVELNPDR